MTPSPSPEPRSLQDIVLAGVAPLVTSITARSVLAVAMRRAGCRPGSGNPGDLTPGLRDEFLKGIALYLHDPAKLSECRRILDDIATQRAGAVPRSLELPIATEQDVVAARTAVRDLSRNIGFKHTDQIKIATAVSELSRNIYVYASKGVVRAGSLANPRAGLRLYADDDGPGIPNLDQILSGAYRSRSGMGLGLRGCKQLMDEFQVVTSPGRGTHITMAKFT